MNAAIFLADAYSTGQTAGVIFRWVFLLVLGAVCVRRLLGGNIVRGRRRSPVGSVLGLLVVTAGLIASVVDATGPDPRIETFKRNSLAGCVGTGAPVAYCKCLTVEVTERADEDFDRLMALDARAVSAGTNAAAMPPEYLQAAEACEPQLAPASA